MNLCTFHNATNEGAVDFQIHSSGRLVYEAVTSNFTFSPSTLIVVADDWVLLGWSKTAGSSTPRFHRYKYSTDAYIHEDGTVTFGDGRTVNHVRIGQYEGVNNLNAEVAVVAVWNRVLSDAEFEALPFSLQAWHALAPAALWPLDQSATTQSVLDLTGGGANQTTLNGTAVSTASVPVLSYGFPLAWTRTPAAGGAAQDTPELYGRPFGQHGQAQMHQLLSQ